MLISSVCCPALQRIVGTRCCIILSTVSASLMLSATFRRWHLRRRWLTPDPPEDQLRPEAQEDAALECRPALADELEVSGVSPKLEEEDALS